MANANVLLRQIEDRLAVLDTVKLKEIADQAVQAARAARNVSEALRAQQEGFIKQFERALTETRAWCRGLESRLVELEQVEIPELDYGG